MKYWAVYIPLVLLLLYLELCEGAPNSNSTSLIQKLEEENENTVQEVARKVRDLWTWIKNQSQSEDTFVGRCAGAFKKMRMTMTFIVFKLGVIGTTLAFLSVFALKSLGIGVLLLILSSVGLFSKFAALKKGGDHEGHGAGQIHLHLHNKPAYSPPIHHHHEDDGWYDRSGHIVTRSPLERLAILDLYKRLGITHTSNLYGSINEDVNVYS